MLHKQKVEVGAQQPGAAPDEIALLRRIAAGDDQAFEALYRCYYPRLTRFLERVTRRPQLTEEILNDTMLVVWRKAHTYNLQSKVSTWIFAIAFRKAMKVLKRVRDPVDDDANALDGNADAGTYRMGPEGELMQQQLRAFLGRALQALSAEHCAVLELTYYQGYACREIAEIIGCPVNTVKTRMFHARRRLKTLLAGRMEDVR